MYLNENIRVKAFRSYFGSLIRSFHPPTSLFIVIIFIRANKTNEIKNTLSKKPISRPMREGNIPEHNKKRKRLIIEKHLFCRGRGRTSRRNISAF